MSAIWGVISKGTSVDVAEIERKMKTGYEKCIIDKFESYHNSYIALGCGIQYFTPEARLETLPIIDEKRNIYFNADVILDNREELLKKLGYDRDDKSVPDGRILYELFSRYKEQCLNDLIGAFAFVYLDMDRNEYYLVTDPTGNRCLQYCINEENILFSTLIKPIANQMKSQKVNEQWITDFLANDNMAMAMDYDITPYENIYRVQAAHYIKITGDKVEKSCYWNPSAKDLKLKNEKEYKQKFKDLYCLCIEQLLRNDSMSMLLSGGLDSTSVACLSAKELKKSNKTMTAFTSIPEKDFESHIGEYYVTNESDAVKLTQEYLEKKGFSLKCEFLDLEGKNSWDERKEEIDIVEIPYKSMQNLLWLKEGMKAAYDHNARIMLTGSYGNITISNSFPNAYRYELVTQLHWITYIKECIAYSKKYKVNIKKSIKLAVDDFFDCFKRKPLIQDEVRKSLGNNFLKDNFLDKHHYMERAICDYQMSYDSKYSGQASKGLMMNQKVFYQSGEIATKHSLATGTILRDPTKDKRLIELCMSFPIALFSQKGITRRLVREYLKDEMPSHVIEGKHYGLQSADTVLRMQKKGKRISEEIRAIFNSEEAKQYLKTEEALRELKKLDNFDSPDKNFQILKLEYTAMTIEFIQSFKGKNN